MINKMSSVKDTCVTISDFSHPSLRSGSYNLTLNQAIETQGEQEGYSQTFNLTVVGERLSLNPDSIHSVFPPLPNGEFEGALPHVLLNSATLPWERTSLPATHPNHEKAPWLAVLTFNNDEAPEIQHVKFHDLVESGTDIVFEGERVPGTRPLNYFSYPDLVLEANERPDTPCCVIDIPKDIFLRIAPKADDLPFLGVVKDERTTNCQDQQKDCYTCSVIQGQRIPKIQTLTHCHLVMLENMGAFLPDNNGSAPFPTETTHVRLVTLCHWSFSINGKENVLGKILKNLDVGPLQMPGNFQSPKPEDVEKAIERQQQGQSTDQDADILTRNALNMGYIPMNHHLRSGGNTVSWCRSPLVPYSINQDVTSVLPFSDSDVAVQYDPRTGMFDVSYGLAWQLGQLMSRCNNSIAKAIYTWRRNIKRNAALTREQNKFNDNMLGISFASNLFMKRFYAAAKLEKSLSEEVIQWLCELRLLHHVPFHYLVPDERMLPEESMRVFYLDSNWVYALIDGAVSLGRVNSAEEDRSQGFFQSLLDTIENGCKNVRKNEKPLTKHFNISGRITGFLLRSQAVSGWKNLKAFGYEDFTENQEVPILRFNVSYDDDFMLCLFDGDVSRIVIQESGSELHCGIDYNTDLKAYTTTLRRLYCSHPDGSICLGYDKPRVSCHDPCPVGCLEPGTSLLDKEVVVSMRDDNQTIRVKETADIILQELQRLNHVPPDFEFTSAHFFIELTEGAVKGVYNNESINECNGGV
ncbi:hypothetical protein MMB68_05885 [Priestia sp. Y58]|uniref:hypothetical protein n=1 Tax=Priestia sp. Y58 TaxID=2922804 RepID=UPI002405FC95|nr:hypothetical protein [Priestia sp. Y58]MDG0029092.1 hypothetical protein [Priestia sp. Y58]